MKTYTYSQTYRIVLTLLLALSLVACNDSTGPSTTMWGSGNKQPKIGLVLGGGGAKASAEIGVLKKLEEMGIKVDCIAGSSMGAVIGSLYAAGYSASEIEKFMLWEDWMKIFDKKKIFNTINIDLETNYDQHHSDLGLVVRPYLQEKLDAVLSKKGGHLFEGLKIPFRCTATIAEKYSNLEEYTFQEGVVATGVIASMSHPCYIFAWEHEGMNLYDGGILNNLPVNLVDSMHADIIIAVDIENSKKIRTDEFASLLKTKYPLPYQFITTKIESLSYGKPILNWLTGSQDIGKREQFIERAKTDDSFIYIHVDLDKYSVADFNNDSIGKMIDLGEKAAEAHRAELEKILK